MENSYKATLLLNLHREGVLAFRTLRYLLLVQAECEKSNIDLGFHIVLDNPDTETLKFAREFEPQFKRINVSEVNFKNLGKSRTYGVEHIRDEIVLFLDGDDFISLNWYKAVIEYLSDDANSRHICHTQYFVGFGDAEFIRAGVDSRDADFDNAELAMDWFFCNNLACRRKTLTDCPVQAYDHSVGFGAEDWHWSAETIAEGYPHVLIPNTYYLYRIKPQAFSLGNAGDFIPKPSRLFRNPGRQLKSVGEIQNNLSRKYHENWADSLTLRSKCATELMQYCEGIYNIEPALTWIYELPEKRVDCLIPKVESELVCAYRRLSAELAKNDNAEIFLIDITNFPGGWSNCREWLSLHQPDSSVPRVVLIDGDHSDEVLIAPENWILVDLRELENDWKTELHVSRLIARLIVDNQPALVCVHPGPRILKWLGRYHLQIAHSAQCLMNIISSPMPDTFAEASDLMLSSMIDSCVNVYLSPGHLVNIPESSVTRYLAAGASDSFLCLLLGEPAESYSLYDYVACESSDMLDHKSDESCQEHFIISFTDAGIELIESHPSGQAAETIVAANISEILALLSQVEPQKLIIVITDHVRPTASIYSLLDDFRSTHNPEGRSCFIARHSLRKTKTGVVAVYNGSFHGSTGLAAELVVQDLFILSADSLSILLNVLLKERERREGALAGSFKLVLAKALESGTLSLATYTDDSLVICEYDQFGKNRIDLVKMFSEERLAAI